MVSSSCEQKSNEMNGIHWREEKTGTFQDGKKSKLTNIFLNVFVDM
jgi:hypothetical protein